VLGHSDSLVSDRDLRLQRRTLRPMTELRVYSLDYAARPRTIESNSFESHYFPWVDSHNQVRKRFLNIGKPVIYSGRDDHYVPH
jgi:hypothetical protein